METTAAITVIEQGSQRGAYDLLCDFAIIQHPKYGRLLICEGYGGEGGNGGMYRWSHGKACKLDDAETLASLAEQHPAPRLNADIDLEAAMYGRELEWPGYAVEKIAKSAGL